jgi:tetrahydromethanopterin S-methyltransferase subunit F
MKADRFARQKRAKIALGVLAVGLLTAGVLTVILVMMGRKHPGF